MSTIKLNKPEELIDHAPNKNKPNIFIQYELLKAVIFPDEITDRLYFDYTVTMRNHLPVEFAGNDQEKNKLVIYKLCLARAQFISINKYCLTLNDGNHQGSIYDNSWEALVRQFLKISPYFIEIE